MPYKKRLHARFPPARIKKIMQMDDEVGKVSSTVPVMVSRALERFLEYIMVSSANVTSSKDAKTLTAHHILQVITNDNRLQFMRETALKYAASVGNTSNSNREGETTAASSSSKSNSSNPVSNSKKSSSATIAKSTSDFSKQSDELEDDDDTDEDDDEDFA